MKDFSTDDKGHLENLGVSSSVSLVIYKQNYRKFGAMVEYCRQWTPNIL